DRAADVVGGRCPGVDLAEDLCARWQRERLAATERRQHEWRDRLLARVKALRGEDGLRALRGEVAPGRRPVDRRWRCGGGGREVEVVELEEVGDACVAVTLDVDLEPRGRQPRSVDVRDSTYVRPRGRVAGEAVVERHRAGGATVQTQPQRSRGREAGRHRATVGETDLVRCGDEAGDDV